MKTMDNFMIDLETMGTKPYSVIMSIGAVAFDLKTGEKGDSFYQNIDKASSIKAGLTVDQSTKDWWDKQPREAYNKMFVDTVPLETALRGFQSWIKLQPGSFKYVWGNSASFDLGLLDNAYDIMKIPKPWMYTNERCCRTIVALAPSIKGNWSKPAGVHDPIIDCNYQIDYVVATIKAHSISGEKEKRFKG